MREVLLSHRQSMPIGHDESERRFLDMARNVLRDLNVETTGCALGGTTLVKWYIQAPHSLLKARADRSLTARFDEHRQSNNRLVRCAHWASKRDRQSLRPLSSDTDDPEQYDQAQW